jgi:hypothetical protein
MAVLVAKALEVVIEIVLTRISVIVALMSELVGAVSR